MTQETIKSVPSVSVQYAANGNSTKSNELGMRPMQEQVYEKRLNYPLYWIGKRRPGDAWPTGVYDGTVTLTPAAGGAPRQKQVSVVVE